MNFKENYKKELDKVAPSEEFLKSLSEKMENERAMKKRRKIRVMTSVVSAAACVAVIVSASFFFNKKGDTVSPQTDYLLSSSEINVPGEKADMASSAAATESVLQKNWHEENISDTEAFHTLVSKIRSDLKKLYFSDTNSFESDNLLSETETEELVGKIENAERTETHGNPVTNYMAVFKDGSIAKFTVCDDDTIYIKGIETSFKF